MSAEPSTRQPMAQEPSTARLDEAFAALLQARQPSDDVIHQRIVVRLSQRFSQGHACLDLSQEDEAWRSAAKTMRWTQGDNSPLVLQEERLYLRRSWRAEQDILSTLRERLCTTHEVPHDLPLRLHALFGDTHQSTTPDWQQVACALACRSGVTLITGGPGTGKTSTVVRLLSLLQSDAIARGQPLRMALAAPTGKAAARLGDSVSAALDHLPGEMRAQLPVQAQTLHKLLGIRGTAQGHRMVPLALDVLVVDEASMIDLELKIGRAHV